MEKARYLLNTQSMETVLNVQKTTVPMQNGRTAETAAWDEKTVGGAMTLLNALTIPEGSELFMSASGAPWTAVAFRHILSRRFDVRLLLGAPEGEFVMLSALGMNPDEPFWKAESYTAQPPKGPAPPFPADADINVIPGFGQVDEGLGMSFRMEEERGRLFIDCCADEPGSPVHTFDIRDLGRIVLPDIPEDMHLFLHIEGSAPVQWCVGAGYAGRCRSLSMCTHAETEYTCAVSKTDEYRIGQTTPRRML